MARYKRGYRPRKSGSGFTVFIIIVILAVAAGYAGTKFIIYPYFLEGNGNIENEQGIVDQDASTSDSGVDVTSSVPSITINPQSNTEDTPKTAAPTVSTDIPQEQTAPIEKGPFTVQFGSFTTREAAETFTKELTQKGIYSYIYESGDLQKVLGLPYGEKEKAKEAVSIVSTVVEGAFVVDMSTLID